MGGISFDVFGRRMYGVFLSIFGILCKACYGGMGNDKRESFILSCTSVFAGLSLLTMMTPSLKKHACLVS